MSQENIDRLRSIYSEWEKGNFRAGAEVLAPDIVFEPMVDGHDAYLGPAAVEEQMREFLAQWDDFRVEAEEFTARGDTVLVTEHQSGKGKRSGVKAETTFFAIWTFRDGLVVRVQWQSDRAKALEAAGLRE